MNRLSWILVVALVSLLLASSLGGCDLSEQPVRQLKFSVVASIDSSWYKGAVRFADLVKERSRGKLIITVYPDAQLAGGNQTKELEMLQEGKIDFTYHSTLLYMNLDKKFFVLSMPWIFSSYEDVDRVLNGAAGRKLLDLTSTYKIVGLAYGENGFRQLTNSKREIRTPEDMKGLRVRVPNAPMYLSIFKALGAEPTIMNFAAVYKALQEDAMDGQENPIDVIVSSKLYDVQKYITLWNYSYDALILGVNQTLYNSLDKPTQDLLRQAAVEASTYQIQLSREAARTKLGLLKEKGMVVTELTPEQLQAFRDKMGPIYTEYEPIIGKELLDEVRAASQ